MILHVMDVTHVTESARVVVILNMVDAQAVRVVVHHVTVHVTVDVILVTDVRVVMVLA